MIENWFDQKPDPKYYIKSTSIPGHIMYYLDCSAHVLLQSFYCTVAGWLTIAQEGYHMELHMSTDWPAKSNYLSLYNPAPKFDNNDSAQT